MERIEKVKVLKNVNIFRAMLIHEEFDAESLNTFITHAFNAQSEMYRDEFWGLIEGIKKKDVDLLHNCLTEIKRKITVDLFKYPCKVSWDSLTATNDSDTRYCKECKKYVYKVSSDEDFLKRRNLEQCIALDVDEYVPGDNIKTNLKSGRIEFEYDLGLPF